MMGGAKESEKSWKAKFLKL